MDLLDDLDAENVTPGFLRSELTRWVDGEPLRATKPPCKWWEIKQAPRAHRAIGGRAQPTFNLTLTEVRRSRSVPAPGAVPHVPVAQRACRSPPSKHHPLAGGGGPRPRRHLARDTRLSGPRHRRARPCARQGARRGNGGPQRAKTKTSATRPDNLKTTSLPSRNLPA